MPLALVPDAPAPSRALGVAPRLWLYTNYDCNLSCSYCVAESTPRAARRGLPPETAYRLIDEAADLGFEELFLTGGEPFILPHIFDLIAHAQPLLRVTVLSNGVALRGARLSRLLALPREGLTIQISLDGATPDTNDNYRGAGSWHKAIAAIRALREAGRHVRLGTTLTPEITVNRDGVYWHPVSTDDDLLVTRDIFPLADAVRQIATLSAAIQDVTGGAASQFR